MDRSGSCGIGPVSDFIELHAHGLQPFAGSFTDLGRIFSDTRREDDRVDVAESRHVGADIFAYAVGVDVEGKSSPRVACRFAL